MPTTIPAPHALAALSLVRPVPSRAARRIAFGLAPTLLLAAAVALVLGAGRPLIAPVTGVEAAVAAANCGLAAGPCELLGP